jgi:phosphoribosyl 1,2-cyclic phosphate phosphodiesterase
MPTLQFLGTGASFGVPDGTCTCDVCVKAHDINSRFFRTRSSALIENDGKFLLLDCGSDFWFQTLRWNVKQVDAVFLSHEHEDHMGGVSNLRAFASTYEAAHPPLPVYCRPKDAAELKKRFAYVFDDSVKTTKPKLDVLTVAHGDTRELFGMKITFFEVSHPPADALGFRIDDLAYIPDVLSMPEKSMKLLFGIKTLVIMGNSDVEYPKQMSIFDAAKIAEKLAAKRVYFTHIGHRVERTGADKKLPPNMQLAFDGQKIEF